mmetsp:Transcript_24717/g.44538  ORF Transcript_24717/g.44538 Transcript_24717/m.44538 type:complete len:98 (-) Transcript_24717:22-315(-)
MCVERRLSSLNGSLARWRMWVSECTPFWESSDSSGTSNAGFIIVCRREKEVYFVVSTQILHVLDCEPGSTLQALRPLVNFLERESLFRRLDDVQANE